MPNRILNCMLFVAICSIGFSEEEAHAPAVSPVEKTSPPISPSLSSPNSLPRPTRQEWMALLERLRMQPRPGEISNGQMTTTLTNIFGEDPAATAKSNTLGAEYDKALMEKAAKWESDL